MKSNNALLRAAQRQSNWNRANAIAAFILLAVSLAGLFVIGWGA